MAKRGRSSTAITTVRATPVRQPAPIIRIAAPRPVTTTKPHKKRGHRKGGGKGGMTYSDKMLIGVAVGGAAMGFIEKQGLVSFLPEIPLVGRKGALAIACWFMAKRGMGGDIVKDIGIAAAAVSGYELGKEGKISGEDDD